MFSFVTEEKKWSEQAKREKKQGKKAREKKQEKNKQSVTVEIQVINKSDK